MMRTAARVDINQAAIVKALRQCGVSVQSMAQIGKGCPDLLVGHHNKNWAIEVKGAKGKLTPDQLEWIQAWRGEVHIVRTVDDALRLVGVIE